MRQSRKLPKLRRRPEAPYAERLANLGAWLASERGQIAAQVTVRERRRGAEQKTTIAIDRRTHCPHRQLAELRIHTRKTFLPRAHFSSEAKVRIANATRSEAGRVIYCEDPVLGEVIAALAFHIPAHAEHPLLITAFALRDDVDANPRLARRSLAAVLVLKHYLHAISARLGRGGHLDIDLADRNQLELMRDLGFRPAPRLPNFRPGGTHLRQAAPG